MSFLCKRGFWPWCFFYSDLYDKKIGLCQILVWKVAPQYDAPSLTNPVEDHIDQSSPFSNHVWFGCRQFEAVHLCKLAGHEGSIFRIAWSSDGSKLLSVSDDRRWISFLSPIVLIVYSVLFWRSHSILWLVSLFVQCSCLDSSYWKEWIWRGWRFYWPWPCWRCAVWSQCQSMGLLY